MTATKCEWCGLRIRDAVEEEDSVVVKDVSGTRVFCDRICRGAWECEMEEVGREVRQLVLEEDYDSLYFP